MAENGFVIKAAYTPTTFQDRIAPWLIAAEAYKQQEKEYLDRQDKIDRFSYLNDYEDGSLAKNLYQGFANAYKSSFDDFAQNGLSIDNKSSWLNVRKNYGKTIGRLEKAEADREADINEQKTLYLQDPTRMFSKNAINSTLDPYLTTGTRQPYKSYSGALLTKQVSTAVSALAKNLVNYGKTGKLDDYTNTWLIKYGLDPTDVMKAIENPGKSSIPILDKIVNGALESSGITEWADTPTLARFKQYAAEGLWSGIGETKVEKYEDYAARTALAHQYAQEQAAAKAKNNSSNSGLLDDVNSIPDDTLTYKNIPIESDTISKYFLRSGNPKSKGRLVLKNAVGLSKQFANQNVFIYDRKSKAYRFKTPEEMNRSFVKYLNDHYNNSTIPGESQDAFNYRTHYLKYGASIESSRELATKETNKSLNKNYQEFLDILKKSGIDPKTYRFSNQLDKFNTPLMKAGPEYNINNNINRYYMQGTPAGFVETPVLTMNLDKEASDVVKGHMSRHVDQIKEISDITGTAGKLKFNEKSASGLNKILEQTDSKVNSITYEPSTNSLIANIGSNIYHITLDGLPASARNNLVHIYQAYQQNPTQTNSLLAKDLMTKTLMRMFEVYNTRKINSGTNQ